jgi:hypothetical protein
MPTEIDTNVEKATAHNGKGGFNTKLLNQIELIAWVFIAGIISLRFWVDVWKTWGALDKWFGLIFEARYHEILLSAVILLFPFLFLLIFGNYPLAYLRQVRAKRDSPISLESEQTGLSSGVIERQERGTIIADEKAHSAEKFLESLAYSSRKLSESIYARAGVYLLIGVLIAFSGLLFFYTQTATLAEVKDIYVLLPHILPRFGILFFIELVAFFFLKQYRTAMEEFRYFEAIKRAREETLALVRFIREPLDNIDAKEILTRISFYSNAGKLSSGETTELIESKKLDRSDLELLEKVFGMFSILKK